MGTCLDKRKRKGKKRGKKQKVWRGKGGQGVGDVTIMNFGIHLKML